MDKGGEMPLQTKIAEIDKKIRKLNIKLYNDRMPNDRRTKNYKRKKIFLY